MLKKNVNLQAKLQFYKKIVNLQNNCKFAKKS